MNDPSLTSVQQDLVNLLHEVGGVQEDDRVLRGVDGWLVTLTMGGDGGRRVRVEVDAYGGVEWKIIGARP